MNNDMMTQEELEELIKQAIMKLLLEGPKRNNSEFQEEVTNAVTNVLDTHFPPVEFECDAWVNDERVISYTYKLKE